MLPLRACPALTYERPQDAAHRVDHEDLRDGVDVGAVEVLQVLEGGAAAHEDDALTTRKASMQPLEDCTLI